MSIWDSFGVFYSMMDGGWAFSFVLHIYVFSTLCNLCNLKITTEALDSLSGLLLYLKTKVTKVMVTDVGDTILGMHHTSYWFTFIALVGALVLWTARESSFAGLFLCHQVGQEPFSEPKAGWHGAPHVHTGKPLTLQSTEDASTLRNENISWPKTGQSLGWIKTVPGLALSV